MKEVSDISNAPKIDEKAAVIATEAGNEALTRLDWMMIQPQVIIDASCAIGEVRGGLQKRYPTAQIIEPNSPLYPSLPSHSVDMVFANLLLPFQTDINAIKNVLAEWYRLLRPEGLLMWTALGVDTLQQLRGIINPSHTPLLFDMHDGGDMLVHAGFADPVLDVDYYTLSYEEPEKLWHELQASGMLMGEVAPAMKTQLRRTVEGCFELTYEVIHAHAFAPQPQAGFKPSEDGVTRIPLSHLRRQKS